jgi:hypothetical protein
MANSLVSGEMYDVTVSFPLRSFSKPYIIYSGEFREDSGNILEVITKGKSTSPHESRISVEIPLIIAITKQGSR